MDPNQDPPNPATLPVQTLPVESPLPPSEIPKQRKMPTLLAIILIAILLGGLSVGTYIMNMKNNSQLPKAEKKLNTKTNKAPSASPTTMIVKIDKTYSNIKDLYTVTYPGSWSIYEFQDTIGATFIPEGMKKDPSYGVISIAKSSKSPNLSKLSFEEYVKVAAADEIQGHEKLLSIEQVTTTSSIIGYKTVWQIAKGNPSPFSTSTITYFPLQNDQKNTIQISLSDDTYKDIYTQIITSFKYSDQSHTTTNTSDWKTYKNATYSINYPPLLNYGEIIAEGAPGNFVTFVNTKTQNPNFSTEQGTYQITIEMYPLNGPNIQEEKRNYLPSISHSEPITIGNLSGETYSTPQEQYTYVIKNKILYIFKVSLLSKEDLDPTIKEIFRSMIETVSFAN